MQFSGRSALLLVILFLTGSSQTLPFRSCVSKKFSDYKHAAHKLIDEKLCEYWGEEDASPIFQKQIRTFLKYHKVKNPDSIPIRKFCPQALKINSTTYAIARPTGIWINEKLLQAEESLTSLHLYVLAHEATHFALQQKQTMCLIALHNTQSYFSSIRAAVALLSNTLFLNTFARWTIKNPDWVKSKSMYIYLVPFIYVNMVTANLREILTSFIFSLSKQIEKEADLGAAQLLCDLGFRHVIDDQIKGAKENLEQGRNVDAMHPPLKEAIAYFETFLKEWEEKQEHKKEAALVSC